MNAQDLKYIRKANQLAWDSAAAGFGPFAALLVYKDKIVLESKDRCIQDADPTAHAEMVVIRQYSQMQKVISLEGYTLYTSTEPCVMCSGAIHWARISKVVYSVSQAMLKKASKGNPKPPSRDLINIGGQKVEVIGPILGAEGIKVYEHFPFRSKKRQFEAYHSKQ